MEEVKYFKEIGKINNPEMVETYYKRTKEYLYGISNRRWNDEESYECAKLKNGSIIHFGCIREESTKEEYEKAKQRMKDYISKI